MNDIFQEVDEAIKKEKLEKFWHNHKDKIVTGIIGFIAITAVFTFYKNWDRNRDGVGTAILYQTVENEKYDNLEQANGSLKSVGYLIAGGMEFDKDKNQSAEYFTQAAEKTSKRDIKDLASLYSVNFKEDAEVQKIKTIAEDKKSAWKYHAAIQKAALLADEKNYEEAINALQSILDSNITAPTLKQRATAMSHIYKIEKSNVIIESKDNEE